MNQRVINYYKSLESRLGYTYLTGNIKHFGYYPKRIKGISEKEAQNLMHELLVQKLQLKRNAVVLDAGSGRGTVATYLAYKYGVNIKGVDIVDFEVALAKKRAAHLGLDRNVQFFLKDYSNTHFPAHSFDAIYTMETLVHAVSIHRALKEFNRVLKPGGRIALFEYSIAKSSEFDPRTKAMLDLIIRYSAMQSLPTMHHDAIKKHLKTAGFIDIKTDDITNNVLPSMYRLYRYAYIPYQAIKLFHLQKYFINTTWGVEMYHIFKKELLKYRIFTAKKPNGT